VRQYSVRILGRYIVSQVGSSVRQVTGLQSRPGGHLHPAGRQAIRWSGHNQAVVGALLRHGGRMEIFCLSNTRLDC
jgi:hypothetical protein